MRKLIALLLDRIGARLPHQFRILHQQFLLRVVDLEALSLEADIPRFLGQFAGVLIMLSFIHSVAVYWFIVVYPYRLEHYLISTTMLAAGLITVVSWDSVFPDRRDIMVLAPLPIRPGMILGAKIAASTSLLGIALLALNTAPGLLGPLLLGQLHASIFGFFQVLAAYWIAMIAAILFLYCSVLTIQGLTALILPRRAFLRLSAALQLLAFGAFISVYFLEPSLGTLPELLAPQNHQILVALPQFWFLALLNQINGSLPPELAWLAYRAWIALAIVISGAAASLLFSYLRTMKATLEAPDLVPGASGFHWFPRLGGSLRLAIAAFAFRSLSRSRQHRVVYAFFIAIVAAIGVTCLRRELYAPAPEPLPTGFLTASFMMMTLAVIGLRAVFSLPISLNANWVLRTTQLRPTSKYIEATRATLLLFSVLPMMVTAVLLSLNYRPRLHVAQHLGILAIFGCLLVELALINFDKVPFTCSYLPGKSNIQTVFWGFFVWTLLTLLAGVFELDAIRSARAYSEVIGIMLAALVALGTFNRLRARNAVLYFEDLPPEVVTRLGLIYIPPSPSASPSVSEP
ncbi:MAG TPA: hypothetical protein VGI45_28675 [Terracidiphilus sp.]|jgi:hypothetical protein